jgi:hypothetical protein
MKNKEQTEILVGARVAYACGCPGVAPEYGQVTSLNQHYVFVRFDGEFNSKACRRADLRLV